MRRRAAWLLVLAFLGCERQGEQPEPATGAVDRAAQGVKKGVDKGAQGVKTGAQKAAQGVKTGAEKASQGIQKGADAVNRAFGGGQ